MLSAHPLDFYDTSGCVPACDLHKTRRRRIKMAGWIIAGKIIQTKGEKRRPMKFLSMEDRTGTFEVTIFPEAYAKYAGLTVGGGALSVTGRVEDDMGALSLVADRIEPCSPRATPTGGASR
jgi:DNA polymerase III alpha subunit